MDATTQDVNMSSDTVSIIVRGLVRAGRDSQAGADVFTAHVEELQLSRNALVTAIWDELAGMCDDIQINTFKRSSVEVITRPRVT